MPIYSNMFKARWIDACKANVSSHEYVQKMIFEHANNYIETYFDHMLDSLKFHLHEGRIIAEVKDKNKFSAMYKEEKDKIPQFVLIKSLVEQNERIKLIKEKAIAQLAGLYPGFEEVILRIPIEATFASPINAGAMPTPSGGNAILLNEGIVNAAIYIKKAYETLHSTHEKWEETFSYLVANSCEHFRKNNLNFSKEDAEEQWLKLLPPPTQEEIIFKGSEAFLSALEILNLKTPPLNIINRRSDFNPNHRQPIIVGPLEGDSYTGDTMTVQVLEPFIFFHELGHVLLGHTQTLRYWYLNDPSGLQDLEKRIEISHQMEFEADEFALEALLNYNDHLIFVSGGILMLFELLSFCEINYNSLDQELRSKLFKRIGLKDGNENRSKPLKSNFRTHPSSITRLGRIWQKLVSHQPDIDYEKVRWWKSLSDKEKIIHMATTAKGDADYSDYRLPSPEAACQKVINFVNLTYSSAIQRIMNDEDKDNVIFTIPNENYPFQLRYNRA